MSRKTDVVETILIQVYSLKPGALLRIDSITNISVIFLKLLRTPILPMGQLWSAACHVHCAAIPHQYKQ